MATSTSTAAGCATEQKYMMPTGQDVLSARHTPSTGDMGAGVAPTSPVCSSDRIAEYTSAVAGGPVGLPAAPAAMYMPRSAAVMAVPLVSAYKPICVQPSNRARTTDR